MKRVLIVEDQADIRELIRMTLEFEDVEIHEAPDGEAGLAKVYSLLLKLVLLDVMMPGALDGFSVCKRIRSDPSLGRIRIILLSARAQPSDRSQGLEAGADEYLVKPFSPRELLAVVNRLS